jgi:phospholipase/carboxylesterase
MSSLDRFPHRIRPARDDPEGVLVLLHGRGTSEHDLFPLIELLDPERRLAGVTPRGPLALPPGGAHWYVIQQIGFPEPRTFFATYEALAEWIDALPEAVGAPAGSIVIGGFSQGAVMAYALGLSARRPSPFALIALSGFIPEVDGFALDLDSRGGLPVAIGHGTFDRIIPVQYGREAREVLQQGDLDVVYRESPMAHSVDPAFLQQLGPWIQVALARQPGARD